MIFPMMGPRGPGGRQRMRTAYRLGAILLALAVATPAAAAGLTLQLSRFLPRVEMGALFELERASPSGSTGPRASESASTAEDDADPADAPRKPETAPPARPKPGAAGQERAPRWKSLLPGALK